MGQKKIKYMVSLSFFGINVMTPFLWELDIRPFCKEKLNEVKSKSEISFQKTT